MAQYSRVRSARGYINGRYRILRGLFLRFAQKRTLLSLKRRQLSTGTDSGEQVSDDSPAIQGRRELRSGAIKKNPLTPVIGFVGKPHKLQPYATSPAQLFNE